MKPSLLPVRIRWMIRRDMPEVLSIESASFEFPWGEEDFIRCLRQRNCIGMACESDEKVVGFMVYELHKHKLRLLNIATHPDHRLKGVGRQMIDKLTRKLSHDHRSRIVLEARESNLDAQLFFRSTGFRCVETMRCFYRETDEDAYVFVYRHQANHQAEAA